MPVAWDGDETLTVDGLLRREALRAPYRPGVLAALRVLFCNLGVVERRLGELTELEGTRIVTALRLEQERALFQRLAFERAQRAAVARAVARAVTRQAGQGRQRGTPQRAWSRAPVRRR